jgi:hypothetical protein
MPPNVGIETTIAGIETTIVGIFRERFHSS